MLQYQTIEPVTLELLIDLLAIPEFKNLRLAGGTSLALQIGHRKSIDLDLFGTFETEPDEILDILNSIGSLTIIRNMRNIHVFMINGIKVDIINYSYPWLHQANKADDLRLASIEDIAAMKLAAIAGRGTRKDFIDIHFLLRQFSLQEMLDLYTAKYADGSVFMILKSLIYFDDAENDPEPFMFETIDWNLIKSELRDEVTKLT
ncbi:hypothetical protein DWW91_15460 [Parabacteroides sp. AF17-3]|uniref:nucleotidyl transferase AbiEii/AbiGii toxin family protein n=1 Tax=Parabacteroides TaxID=375288 RepID=UPI000EFED18C|nr:nucleotidyl transferase AbiEii/AbiGii toxin family protein [Parabacteroides sp. AF17-3]RKU67462.1 hypothetical protein DWW91_15460 [Parabacteroides sp. AF17-3]